MNDEDLELFARRIAELTGLPPDVVDELAAVNACIRDVQDGMLVLRDAEGREVARIPDLDE